MELKDFDRMSLQPGEVLVLRPHKQLSCEEMHAANERVRRAGVARCIVVPHDFDIMVVQDMQEPDAAEPSPEDLTARNTEVKAAYDAGRVIQVRECDSDEWFAAHRIASPHAFDFDKYVYALARKRVKP